MTAAAEAVGEALERPQSYDGIEGLEPRTQAVLGVVSIGLKSQVLYDWRRDHHGYEIPTSPCKCAQGGRPKSDCRRCRGTGRFVEPIIFRDPPKMFIKVAKGQGPKGSRITDLYRPLLPGFEPFNLNAKGEPAGQTTLYGYLPVGEVTWVDEEKTRIAAPYFQRQRMSQKCGRMVEKPGSSWKVFERMESHNPPRDQMVPGNQAECRGNGIEATRWMPDEGGRWGWRTTPCLGDDCPFAQGGTCDVTSSLLLHTQARQTGEVIQIRHENHSANTTANIEGFLKRMRQELDQFGLSGQLYGLKVRLQVEMNTKSAALVRGKQLPNRRFPVHKIDAQDNVIEYRRWLSQQIQEAGGLLALPAPVKQIMPPEEEPGSLADFDVTAPQRPRVETLPPDHSEGQKPAEPAKTIQEWIRETYVFKLTPQKIAAALRKAGLKQPHKALPEDTDRKDVAKILDAVLELQKPKEPAAEEVIDVEPEPDPKPVTPTGPSNVTRLEGWMEANGVRATTDKARITAALVGAEMIPKGQHWYSHEIERQEWQDIEAACDEALKGID